MKKYISTFIILLFATVMFGQNVSMQKGYTLPAVVVDGDTLGIVQVQKVYIFPPLKFESHDDYLYYRRLVRDVKKVYPYALLARRTMIEIQLAIDTIPEKRKQKKYVRDKENELMELYKEELKSLSVRQGQILIKLIDREMNKTSFELIKDMRGGTKAIVWQGVAKMFGESLKSEYDPNGEDKLIERIIKMIEQGSL